MSVLLIVLAMLVVLVVGCALTVLVPNAMSGVLPGAVDDTTETL